ncbi:MAG: hypothetical protein Terrestrivirus6_53 [Terrestrivirus sp.]|uniref:Uncharacterized protein n=1 Tax=Terrestrivirus sp. TaxID=2487775 RepID=A0A3G4ZNH0_9VIRU|nr:MAG: hypothetical protein Terrestrivirus6_53 [Terrestrivirus sp.]
MGCKTCRGIVGRDISTGGWAEFCSTECRRQYTNGNVQNGRPVARPGYQSQPAQQIQSRNQPGQTNQPMFVMGSNRPTCRMCQNFANVNHSGGYYDYCTHHYNIFLQNRNQQIQSQRVMAAPVFVAPAHVQFAQMNVPVHVGGGHVVAARVTVPVQTPVFVQQHSVPPCIMCGMFPRHGNSLYCSVRCRGY